LIGTHYGRNTSSKPLKLAEIFPTSTLFPDILSRMDSSISLTGQLRLYADGYREVGDSILDEIFPRLRQIAMWKLARRDFRNAFTPTELVGETWLTRLHRGNWNIESRDHFFCVAGKAMQQVLLDLARKQLTERRGGGAVHFSIDELTRSSEPSEANAEQVVAIGMLIGQLAEQDACTAVIVQAHYIAGYELQEIAEITGLSLRKVRYRWEKGKMWLAARLVPGSRR
jgi:RNA polymerase sigma factor (TIGR02999 family)